MGHRPHTHVVKVVPSETSLPSPNATVPAITVDIRVFWPSSETPTHEVECILSQALGEVLEGIAAGTTATPEDCTCPWCEGTDH